MLSNKKIKHILFLFTIFFIGNSFAQENESKIKFYIHPNQSVIIVDTIKLVNTNIISLPQGSYNVKIWHPQYSLFDTVITVNQDQDVIIKKVLKQSPEFLKYHSDLTVYKAKMFFTRTAPITALAGASIFTLYSFQKMNRAKWSATKHREDFEYLAPGTNKNSKEKQFQEFRAQEVLYRDRFYTGTKILTGTAVLSATLFIVSRHIKKPLFSEEIKLSFNGDILNPASSQLSINYSF